MIFEPPWKIFVRLFLDAVIYVCTYVGDVYKGHMCIVMYDYMWGRLMLPLGIFHNHSPPCVLKQGLLLSLELAYPVVIQPVLQFHILTLDDRWPSHPPTLHLGFGDLNPSYNGCMASDLSPEPSPSTCFLYQ